MFDINDCLVYVTCSQAKLLADVFNEKLMEFGISKVQWSVLYYLGFNENISVCQLANMMKSKHSSATRLLSRMEQEGYVQRTKDSEDRRITHLKLTDKGHHIRKKVLPICEEISYRAINNIPQKEVEIYREVLDKLVNNITAY